VKSASFQTGVVFGGYGTDGSNNQNFQLGYAYGGSDVIMLYAWGANDQATSIDVSDLSLADNAWHHFVVSYDSGASSLTVYVDGDNANKDTAALGFNFATTADIVGIGGEVNEGTPDTLDRNFTGSIDDFQIYDHTLSGFEAQWLYDNPGYAIPVPGVLSMSLIGLGIVGLVRPRRRAA